VKHGVGRSYTTKAANAATARTLPGRTRLVNARFLETVIFCALANKTLPACAQAGIALKLRELNCQKFKVPQLDHGVQQRANLPVIKKRVKRK
jgi:hypothetical protein